MNLNSACWLIILQAGLQTGAIMKKLDPKGCDPDVFERTLQKAKAIIYGSKEANGLIKDDDTERMDTMEKTLERVIEDLEDRR